jgi:hypothetical protein
MPGEKLQRVILPLEGEMPGRAEGGIAHAAVSRMLMTSPSTAKTTHLATL